MHCPFCRHEESRVVDSRSLDDGSAIRRRRQCQSCSKRFTTMETTALTVVKRSGVAEPFDRSNPWPARSPPHWAARRGQSR
ncbi:MAG: hypothetical protein Q4G34_09170, partial [Micrococcus sp.]|nr:hypothetical protein [Micrococcus sp.]